MGDNNWQKNQKEYFEDLCNVEIEDQVVLNFERTSTHSLGYSSFYYYTFHALLTTTTFTTPVLPWYYWFYLILIS